MQKKFVSKKWIAFVLSLILVVGSLPVNAIALDSAVTIGTIPSNESLDVIATSEEQIYDDVIGQVVEITSLREVDWYGFA